MALMAPFSPSQLLFPPVATPESEVVSDFSKPTPRSPPSSVVAAAVPSVVIEVMVPPRDATLIDQPWAPLSRGLFDVVSTQSMETAWTAPGANVASFPQEPSNESSSSCAWHCPATAIQRVATKARRYIRFIAKVSLFPELFAPDTSSPLNTAKEKSPQNPFVI